MRRVSGLSARHVEVREERDDQAVAVRQQSDPPADGRVGVVRLHAEHRPRIRRAEVRRGHRLRLRQRRRPQHHAVAIQPDQVVRHAVEREVQDRDRHVPRRVDRDVGDDVIGRRRERPGRRALLVVRREPEARSPGDPERSRLDVAARFDGVDPLAVVGDDDGTVVGAGRREADDPRVPDDAFEAASPVPAPRRRSPRAAAPPPALRRRSADAAASASAARSATRTAAVQRLRHRRHRHRRCHRRLLLRAFRRVRRCSSRRRRRRRQADRRWPSKRVSCFVP